MAIDDSYAQSQPPIEHFSFGKCVWRNKAGYPPDYFLDTLRTNEVRQREKAPANRGCGKRVRLVGIEMEPEGIVLTFECESGHFITGAIPENSLP